MGGIDFDKEIAQIYRDMELYLIESMQRNLTRHLAEEAKTGLSYPQWQAEKLKELKRYQRENQRIIRSHTRGLSDKVAEHMKLELRQGSKHEFKRYKQALGKGYKPAKVMKDSFFKVNDRKVSSMINALQNDLGVANTAVLRMMNDTYRQTIFRAGMYASNGVMTETQAYDMAVKDFLMRGINCIEYRDGRRVNIADYASMAVRTANQRAYMVGEGEFRKSIGETLVIISHHATACKLCKPFERKVLIDDVYSGGKPEDGDYMLLSQAMKLGLFHPRCRHGLGTYYPELEDINHYNDEENDVSDYGRYDRAHIENMVQRYKRLTVGSVDPENVAMYRAKLEEWKQKISPGSVEKTKKDGIIEAKAVDGNNVVGDFQPRDGFDSLIDDIIDYQGYNGAPKVVDSEKEFNQFVQEDHFLAERTIRASNQDVLDEYIDQLLCKNGEDYFYVNCGVGGAQYGQGMYCAADYTKGKIGLSNFQHEIDQYSKMNGAGCYKVEWLTLDKSAKILKLPYGEKADEYIADRYIEAYIKKHSRASDETINKYIALNSRRYTVSSSEYDDLMREIAELKREIGDDVFKQATNATMYKSNGSKFPRVKDPGVLAAEMGYDAINAVEHGATKSYTVVLNRTKVIFYGGENYVP